MAKPEYTILICDQNGSPITQPIRGSHGGDTGQGGWSKISITHKFNTAAAASFDAKADDELLAAVNTPMARAHIIRDGAWEKCGPIDAPGPFGYEASRDGLGAGQVTVTFADDLAELAANLVYPDPAHASTAQTAARYTISAVNAETALRDLVNLNAGPGALAGREVPGLILGDVAGVGSAVTQSFRFTQLGDALRAVAVAGGGLGFRVVVTGSLNIDAQIEFQVYQPRDLAGSVRFSRSLGNLRAITFEPSAPTATVAIVGGADAGIDRVIRERSDTAALAAGWRRREVFVDSAGAANSTEMDANGDAALASAGATLRMQLTAIDTAWQRYRDHYQLGDKVTAEVWPGYAVSDLIGSVQIEVAADGSEVVTPIIGLDDTDSTTNTAGLLRQLVAALNNLSTVNEVAVP